jgi:hypothetical protein
VRRALWTRRTPAHSSLTRRPVGGCGVRKGPVRAGRTPHRCTRCATRAIVRAWRASARSQGRTLPSTLCSSRRVPSDSARARVRACVLPVGCNQSRRAVVRTRVLTMRSACTCTHIRATTDDIWHENGTQTYDAQHFAVQVYIDASKKALSGGIKLKAESSWFLSASGACGGGPASVNQVRVRPSHWLASAPHVARCMLHVAVACCVLHGVRRCTCAHGQARG